MEYSIKKKIDEEIFSLLSGRRWKSLDSDDIEGFNWFKDLDDTLHKYVLVSGESFSAEGREGVEGFLTEDIIADPATLEFDPDKKIVVVFSNDHKDAAVLTDEVDAASSWLGAISERTELDVYEGFHKVKSKEPIL
jgi:hypothetical protein